MPTDRRQVALRAGVLLAVALTSGGTAAPDDAGRRLYRDGILPSGDAVAAVVQGDVPVRGAELPCAGCHQRSGFGTSEGPTGTPPVSGPALFAAAGGRHPRPAYTAETLVRAIRDGVDPAGRSLDPLMPRYRLSDADAQALVGYLRTLSAETAPGVGDDTVRFATIVSDGVDPDARDAMLDVLETFVREKNGATRLEPRRAQAFPSRPELRAYRRWVLVRWTLHGAPATWGAQLEEAYRREPVFAVLAGLVSGSWQPIHDFCERNEIPCLLPNTDLPAVSEHDFYTVYFSKGVALEAEAIAAHVVQSRSASRVVQVFRKDAVGEAGARALRAALAARTGTTLDDVPLAAEDAVDADALARRLDTRHATAIVLWLPDAEVGRLDGWRSDTPLYLSSTLLRERLAAVPRALRGHGLVAHPFSLPADRALGARRLRTWLESRGGRVRDERIQAQTYFTCLLAGDGVMHLRGLFSRDYLLDTVDHASAGLGAIWSYYPRPSFGPGERYLAQGCYLVSLGGDGAEAVVSGASWMPLGG